MPWGCGRGSSGTARVCRRGSCTTACVCRRDSPGAAWWCCCGSPAAPCGCRRDSSREPCGCRCGGANGALRACSTLASKSCSRLRLVWLIQQRTQCRFLASTTSASAWKPIPQFARLAARAPGGETLLGGLRGACSGAGLRATEPLNGAFKRSAASLGAVAAKPKLAPAAPRAGGG